MADSCFPGKLYLEEFTVPGKNNLFSLFGHLLLSNNLKNEGHAAKP
jgi:hypothetical protein